MGADFIFNAGRGLEVGGNTISETVKPSMVTIPSDDEHFKKLVNLYKPDDEYAAKVISMREAAKRAAIPRYLDADKKHQTTLFGHLVLPRYDMKNRRVRFTEANVNGWGDVTRLQKTQRFREAKLLEQFPVDAFSLGVDMGSGDGGRLGTDDEYHPLTLGPFNRNLYLFDMLDMMSKAFEQFHHHPIAKAAVSTYVHFTLGTGVRVVFANPLVQEVWDTFAERVNFNSFMVELCRDLSIMGEVFIQKERNMNGDPSVRLVDPSTVWEIVTNPRDIRDVLYYHQQFPTQWQLTYKPGDKVSEYVINDIQPDRILHIKINSTVGEKRGRSDLFPVLGWLKRFKDYYNSLIVKAQISNAFVRIITVSGADADVQALQNDPTMNSTPPPGSTIIQNDKVKTDFLSNEGNVAGGAGTVGEDIRSIIATAMNLPPEYLGVGAASASRATALTRSEPAGKVFEIRQALMREVVQKLINFVVADAQVKGILPAKQPRKQHIGYVLEAMKRGDHASAMARLSAMSGKGEYNEPLDTAAEIIFPEIQPEDRSEFITDMNAGYDKGFISHEDAARQWAEKMAIRGYEYGEQMSKREKEQPLRDSGVIPSAVPPATAEAPSEEQAPKPGASESVRRYKRQTKEKPV